MTSPDDTAFPDHDYSSQTGLTKREYFSALAMQGLLAEGGMDYDCIPSRAVKFADALITKLNKPKP